MRERKRVREKEKGSVEGSVGVGGGNRQIIGRACVTGRGEERKRTVNGSASEEQAERNV